MINNLIDGIREIVHHFITCSQYCNEHIENSLINDISDFEPTWPH